MLTRLGRSLTFKVMSYALILSVFNAPLESNKRFNGVLEMVAYASDVESMMDGEEGNADIIELSDSAEKGLENAIGKLESKGVSDEQFGKMVDSEFPKYTKKMEKKIDRMSDKRAERKLKKYDRYVSMSTNKELNTEVNGILTSESSSKDKLKKLHAQSYEDKFKDQIKSDVKDAGGVLKYVKALKKNLKAQKELAMKEYDKSGRYTAGDGKGGGIGLGSILLITGIVLLILGSSVVGAVWITVAWVLVWVFGIIPVGILLIYLIVIAIIAVSVQNDALPETQDQSRLRMYGYMHLPIASG